jgi:dephospho-CoA kinase
MFFSVCTRRSARSPRCVIASIFLIISDSRKRLVEGMNTVKVVSIVGMAGSGKSEVAHVFEEAGFRRVRFGDVTDDEVKKRGLMLNEENERRVRQELRDEHGMAAYALLNIPRIDEGLKTSDVVVDGLYSWEEYILLKERYGATLNMVAVYASPDTRHRRLGSRKVRPLTPAEARERDRTEIEKSHKGGPIAVADFTIINEGSVDELRNETKRILDLLK